MAFFKKNPKGSQGDKKRLDIATVAVIDNITFSTTDRWAYYRLSNTVYDFLSESSKASMIKQLANAFSNLMGERQDVLDCHLIVTSTPVDVDAWEDQVTEVTEAWNRGPGFDRFVAEQVNFLQDESYLRKVTYLGIHLGRRGSLALDATSFVENGVVGAMDTIKQWADTALQAPGVIISKVEEQEARRQEEEVYRTLSTGNMAAHRASSEELLLLIKRSFYPAMPAPYLDVDHGSRIGPGDLELELSSAIHRRPRWLRFDQMIQQHELSGFRATLTVSHLPRIVSLPNPNPFLYYMHSISVPFTCYSRFSLIPHNVMKKRLEKKKNETADELTNLAGAAENADSMTGSAPADVTDAVESMQLMNQMISEEKTPWVEGVYRIVVETKDETMLKDWCTRVRQSFKDEDVAVNWTVGDQTDLFLEQMPGDRLRQKAHQHITDLNYLASSGFLYSSDVGDRVYGSDSDEVKG